MLEFNNVGKVFDDLQSSGQVALQRININFEPGTLSVIQGPSGSGKSSLLYIASGLVKPTSGEILLEGNEIRKITKKRNYYSLFAFISRKPQLLNEFSVYENVFEAVDNKELSNLEKQKCVDDALVRVGLSDYRKAKVKYLSISQRQRVAIARVIVGGQNIILADKPLANVDNVTAKLIAKILFEMANDGKIVIVVSDNDHFTNRCHRIVHMKAGKIMRVEQVLPTNSKISAININPLNKFSFRSVLVQSLGIFRTHILRTILLIIVLSFSVGCIYSTKNISESTRPKIEQSMSLIYDDASIYVTKQNAKNYNDDDFNYIKNVFGNDVGYEPVASVYGDLKDTKIEISQTTVVSSLGLNKISRISNNHESRIQKSDNFSTSIDKSKPGIFLTVDYANEYLTSQKIANTPEERQLLVGKDIEVTTFYTNQISIPKAINQSVHVKGILQSNCNESLMSENIFDQIFGDVNKIPTNRYAIETKSQEEAEKLLISINNKSAIDSARFSAQSFSDITSPFVTVLDTTSFLLQIFAYIIAIISILIISLTFTSGVIISMKEYIVFKMQGMSGFAVIFMYLFNFLILSVISSLVGYLFSLGIINVINGIISYFYPNAMPATVDSGLIGIGILITFAIMCIGGLYPLFRALRTKYYKFIWR